MRYIVILVRSEMVEPEPGAEEQLEIETQPVLCESVGAVYDTIQEASANGNMDWSVWEVVAGKAQRRAVTYPNDMQRITIA